jgi:hypothetical protein
MERFVTDEMLGKLNAGEDVVVELGSVRKLVLTRVSVLDRQRAALKAKYEAKLHALENPIVAPVKEKKKRTVKVVAK